MTDQPIHLLETESYSRWFRALSDKRVRTAVAGRIERLSLGNPGDAAPVGEGVSEMRIHLGAGWRIYYAQRGDALVILIGGGSKRTQNVISETR